MQKRRRRDVPVSRDPSGKDVAVPREYWEELSQRNIDSICERAMADRSTPHGIILPFLGRQILLDLNESSLKVLKYGTWHRADYPLLELLSLVYLLNVDSEPLSNEIIGVHELKDSHFFRGPHELRVQGIVDRFGKDPDGFRGASESLGGEPLDMADLAYRFFPMPKVPLYYLLWLGDEEFDARVSVLFDRTIDRYLFPDAIWGIVNLVSDALLMAPDYPF
ncbi:MAG: DUF3786 domain-containing protein [Deltaproteobacteria bacterium]|nr:DUF3786 domain-containing protein [Deltaproteobacteria bacterium]